MRRPGSGPAPRIRRRRGIVLVVVGALIVVVAIGAFMLQQAMRQQYLEAHRYTFGEIALNLAESGLNLTMEHMRQSSLDAASPFYLALVEKAADQANGTSIPIASPVLDELVGLFDGAASLEVKVELRNFQPFYPEGGLRGLVRDGREKFGELALVARAGYRGVIRTLVAAKQVKVVSVVAPVVSKFTLFLRSQGDQDWNPLRYDRTDPASGLRMQGEPARPLVLFHRAERYPALEEGRFLPLADVFSTVAPDRGGLVYLGGEQPWYLNLVHGIGAGPYEEMFQLRRTRYRMKSDLDGIANEYGLTFGFYDGIRASAKFGSAAAPGDYPRPVPGTGSVGDGTGAVHLMGDVGNVSPTVVLGPAYRSFVTLRLLDGLWYPYRTAGEFSALGGQGPFRGRYDAYERVMARIEHEAYNRAWDYLATNGELLQPDGRVTSDATPFVPPARLAEGALTHLGPAVAGDKWFLYPAPGNPVPGYCRLVRRLASGTGEDVFAGALDDLDGPLLEKVLTAKAVYAVADAAELQQRYMGPDGKLDLPGIVHVRTGDVELGAVRPASSGMLLVQGGITVTGRVEPERPEDTLTLVALGGDLRIQTSERVRASLVALRGQVSSRGRLDVVGSVAARTLDLRSMLAGAEPKTVLYDEELDTTRDVNYRKKLRVFLDKKVHVYLEGH